MELNDRSVLPSVYSSALGLSSSILGISPSGSKPLKTYVVASAKKPSAYKKSGPLKKYSNGRSDCGISLVAKTRILLSEARSFNSNSVSKRAACLCQTALFVNVLRGEPGEGRNPARKRAVSSGVARSVARTAGEQTIKSTAARTRATSLVMQSSKKRSQTDAPAPRRPCLR